LWWNSTTATTAIESWEQGWRIMDGEKEGEQEGIFYLIIGIVLTIIG
jgi:hypothetical protein